MISADDHVLEMEHLWEERLPAKFKDRAPKFWRDPETGLHMKYKDRDLATPGVGGIAFECPGFWDIGERLRAMDSEGIECSVLYQGHVQALNAIIGEDSELYTACMDVYNEWLSEYTRPAAKRLLGVAMLSAFLRPETARDQMQKIKQLGYRAVMMPSFPKGIRYNSREMDPVWAAVAESGIPLSFHVGTTQEFHGYGSLGANVTRNMSPFRPLLAQLTFSGVLERHPNLTVAFVEGGIAWVADTLVSMDKIFRSYYTILRPKLQHLPSFYWKRQCLASFMDDPIGIKLIDDIGVDNVLWSIDYPHPESVYGYAGSVAKSVYDTIGHDKAKKVLGGNAASIYGL
jgi:predicted TIM-barrel fold metal-dependent hydrolase